MTNEHATPSSEDTNRAEALRSKRFPIINGRQAINFGPDDTITYTSVEGNVIQAIVRFRNADGTYDEEHVELPVVYHELPAGGLLMEETE